MQQVSNQHATVSKSEAWSVKTGNEDSGESVGFHNFEVLASSLVTFESLHVNVHLIHSLSVIRLGPTTQIRGCNFF